MTGNTGNAGGTGGSKWVAGPGAQAGQAAPAGRGPKPAIWRAGSIEEYRPEDIRAIVAWIMSDGRLRTDEEIVDEASSELGFARVGTKIDAAIRNEIRNARAAGRPG